MELIRPSVPSAGTCGHVPQALPEHAAASCQECGSQMSLRLCATCGHVGCCESQLGHGRSHAFTAGHPVIYQMPAPAGFIWCYEHRRYVG